MPATLLVVCALAVIAIALASCMSSPSPRATAGRSTTTFSLLEPDVPVPTSGTVAATNAPTTTATVPTTVRSGSVPVTRAAQSAIFGSIGAGPGGTGTADLQDDAGHMWHASADAYGTYRFDGLAAGHYLLTLSASSAAPACSPGGACLGGASQARRDDIQLAPGEQHRADIDAYGPTQPATSTTSVH